VLYVLFEGGVVAFAAGEAIFVLGKEDSSAAAWTLLLQSLQDSTLNLVELPDLWARLFLLLCSCYFRHSYFCSFLGASAAALGFSAGFSAGAASAAASVTTPFRFKTYV